MIYLRNSLIIFLLFLFGCAGKPYRHEVLLLKEKNPTPIREATIRDKFTKKQRLIIASFEGGLTEEMNLNLNIIAPLLNEYGKNDLEGFFEYLVGTDEKQGYFYGNSGGGDTFLKGYFKRVRRVYNLLKKDDI